MHSSELPTHYSSNASPVQQNPSSLAIGGGGQRPTKKAAVEAKPVKTAPPKQAAAKPITPIRMFMAEHKHMVLLNSDGSVVLNPSSKRPGQLFVDLNVPLLFLCTSDYNPRTKSKLLLVSDPTNDVSFPFLTPYLPWISNIFGHWEHTDMQAAIIECIGVIDENIVNEL